jgi:hypothetical protein
MGFDNLFDIVSIDGVSNDRYKKDIEKFYLCNNIHNINKLESILGIDFDNIVIFDYSNNMIRISKKDNIIEINGISKRIILADISLDYIYS